MAARFSEKRAFPCGQVFVLKFAGIGRRLGAAAVSDYFSGDRL